jgi:hypothetical protein
MKKLLVATTIASLVLAAPAARANEWGGLVGGLAGGIIAGAIVSSMQQPRMVYVPVRRHYVAPRPVRVVVVHDHPVVHTVIAPVPVAVPVPVAAPAPAPVNNNNIVVAPAPASAPIIINNSPAPAPAPIIINTTSAPQAAPTSAVADRCQQDFQKTADYLACLKGIAPVAAK